MLKFVHYLLLYQLAYFFKHGVSVTKFAEVVNHLL